VTEKNEYEIPAASIGDTDLNALGKSHPAAAKEIMRLEDLMDRGEETKEEFRTLCQLLYNVGSLDAAEILLRRNLDYYEGMALYTRLFGTAKPDEFQVAIETFKSQFGLELSPVDEQEESFLESDFRTDGGPPRADEFELLSRPCEVRIGYIEDDKIEADVTLFDPGREVFDGDECLFMYFINGVWEISDPMDA